MFKKYYQIAKTSLLEYLEFRYNLFFEIIGGVLTAMVVLFLWLKVFQDSNNNTIGGYSVAEMITYIIGAGIIYSFIFITAQGDEIDNDIRLGGLSNFLLKPINVIGYWLTRDLFRKFFTLGIGIMGYIIILLFFWNNILLPTDILIWILLILSIVLAGLMHFLIFAIFGIVTFWTEYTWGFRFVVRVIMEIATGVIIPISFLPGIIGDAIGFLPFKFMAYFPMQILLGKVGTVEILKNFSFEIAWILLFYTIVSIMWKRGVKHYTAVGV